MYKAMEYSVLDQDCNGPDPRKHSQTTLKNNKKRVYKLFVEKNWRDAELDAGDVI